MLSILIPVYNESACLPHLYQRLALVVNTLSCPVEILFVNDGSTDDTTKVIRSLQECDGRIDCLTLSRNYGKEIALCAGIDNIHGDTLVILDADLQNPPELIPQMLAEIEAGYDDVYGCRMSRETDPWHRNLMTNVYYGMLRRMSDVHIPGNAGDFRMLNSRAIAALRLMRESERNTKSLFAGIGFRKKAVPYTHDVRVAGRTRGSVMKLFDLALKGLTAFSIKPLRIISMFGCGVSLFAFVYLCVVLVKALLWGDPVAGYPSLMCVLLFLGGIILLSLGVMGEYLGIIYRETKKRPLYLVSEYLRGQSPTETSSVQT
jgi:glycosyltransferase involved in cell wall biosynthesis